MFTPIARAIGQLDDPALLGVLAQTLLLSVLSFVLLAIGSIWLVHHLVVGHGTLSWIVGALGGVVAAVSALWLFVPIAVVIAGLFLEPVCRAVERRWYPALPPATGAGLVSQAWDGVVIGARIALLSLLSLLLAIILPGPGHILGWLITAWALGRGMFSAVALRRMSRPQAEQLYRQRRGEVVLQGAALALAGTVPLLNLLLPVLGPAAMVHVVSGAAPPARGRW